MKRVGTAVLALLLSAVAGAGQLAGVTMPDAIGVAGHPLRLNGMGLRTKFFFKIYVAGLYLEHPTHDAAAAVAAEEVKRVTMRFVYGHVSREQLIDAWNDSFGEEKLSPEVTRDVATFESWMSDVRSGQEIVLTYEPGTGTTVELAGQKKGTIPGAPFAQALFRVWLGDHPPSASLKSGLLGK